MTVFTYGFYESEMEAIRWHIGRADYVDVSDQFEDILALKAEIIVINLERIDESALSMIKEYEAETKSVEDREYFYVTHEMFDEWSRDLYENLEDDLAEAGKNITDSELRALIFWEIDINHSGYISDIKPDFERNLLFVDYFDAEQQRTELIIVSLGDEPINGDECKAYEQDYPFVTVAWLPEWRELKSWKNLYYEEVEENDVPPILRPLVRKIHDKTRKYRYAVYGE